MINLLRGTCQKIAYFKTYSGICLKILNKTKQQLVDQIGTSGIPNTTKAKRRIATCSYTIVTLERYRGNQV